MASPQTQYARNGDVSIAYQVVGGSGPDLVLVPGFMSHLDLQWTDPGFSRFMRRLSSFTRLILFDKPGTGLSDPIPHVPTLEERISDLRCVLDTVGSRRTALLGFSEGGPTCVLFAASWPDRASALILYGSFATGRPSDALLRRAGVDPAAYERVVAGFSDAVTHWGEGRLGRLLAPSDASELQRHFWGVFERAGASPAMARALLEASLRSDVTTILPSVRAPTLVIHRRGDVFPVGGGRFLAERIPQARLAEFPGDDHVFWSGDIEPIVGEIQQFLTGARATPEADRMLATVLFTDIVGSTDRARELGDRRWLEVLDAHNVRVRQLLEEFGGREIDSAGDGFFATFDGPVRAVRCARAICSAVEEIGISVRAGVHTGECELIDGKPGGLAIHIGARVAAQAGSGEVLVSRTVRDLVAGSELRFVDRGAHQLKGIPEPVELFAVIGSDRTRPALDGPAAHMRTMDRALVTIAHRLPGVLRFGSKLASRQNVRH